MSPSMIRQVYTVISLYSGKLTTTKLLEVQILAVFGSFIYNLNPLFGLFVTSFQEVNTHMQPVSHHNETKATIQQLLSNIFVFTLILIKQQNKLMYKDVFQPVSSYC